MPDKHFREAYDAVRLDEESAARIWARLESELPPGEEKRSMKKLKNPIRIFILAALMAVLMVGSAYAISGILSAGQQLLCAMARPPQLLCETGHARIPSDDCIIHAFHAPFTPHPMPRHEKRSRTWQDLGAVLSIIMKVPAARPQAGPAAAA